MTWSAAERRHRHVGICISYSTFNITMTIDFREPADHGITIRSVFGVVSSPHLQHGSVSSQHPHPGLPPQVCVRSGCSTPQWGLPSLPGGGGRLGKLDQWIVGGPIDLIDLADLMVTSRSSRLTEACPAAVCRATLFCALPNRRAHHLQRGDGLRQSKSKPQLPLGIHQATSARWL